ncbi:MAG: hypothetical protein JEZ05_00640 [Tenericutes bacterium]|nr:hypothetical protein [Mycoplasmatota bacterium]
MRKERKRTVFFIFMLFFMVALVGCNETTTTVTTDSTTAAPTEAVTTETVTELDDAFYLAGNFTGYIADDSDFLMTAIDDMPGWYEITVDLTADVRDNAYDGHYYKVTDGTWTTCYGVDNYALQPAPVSPTGGGLGSIWIFENGLITVRFDSNTNTIYDDSMVNEFDNPIVYGDFSTAVNGEANWTCDTVSGLELLDSDEDGIYEGDLTLPAYSGDTEEGYSLLIVLSEKYYISEWGAAWGANEQYLFDGTAAGMGTVSYLNPEVETTYHFSFDSTTNITTVSYDFDNPLIYGDFSSWGFGETAIQLTASETDPTIFVGSKVLPAYTGEDDGYSLIICLSSQLFVGSWGESWGALEQYLFDGTAASMGTVSYLKPEVETTYQFSYDSVTHITTVSYDFNNPVVYGDFSSWGFGETAIQLIESEDDSTLFVGTKVFPAYTGEGDGYSLITCLSSQLFIGSWGESWGALEQYTFSGAVSTMGKVTYLDLDEEMELTFTYDSETHITSITPPESKTVAPFEYLAAPTLYGTFTIVTDDSEAFILEGEDAVIMTLVDGETNLYEITLTLDVFTARDSGYYTADTGYRFILVLTKADVGWGYYAGEQYLLDGQAATMGAATYINITVSGDYHFTYNSDTCVTTWELVE